MGLLVVVLSTTSATLAGYFGFKVGQIERVEDLATDEKEAGEPVNILIVGTDSREGIDADDPASEAFLGDGEIGCDCTDTIMVVRIDPEEQSASILSFPRDLWIPIADTGEPARINSAHARGEQVLIDTIRQNFGVPINHYVEVDFVGFEQLVDAVGGVPMWFDAPVRDRNSGLSITQAECQVLDGEQARQFVRARHLQYMDEDGDWVSDGSADLGRITRQQAFIRRAVHKAVSKGLGNPMTLNELVSAGVANVRLDGAFSTGDLLSLGKQFAEYDADDLVGYSIPSEGMRTSAGAAVQIPLTAEADEILNIFRGLPSGTVSPQSVGVSVFNGSGVEGQARDLAGALGSIGFNVQGIGTSPEHLTRTTVRYGEGAEADARMLGRYITGGAALVPDETVAEGEVVLVTGTDFTTVHDQPAPEGAPDDDRTTTSTTATTEGTPGASTTTTSSTTTTTVVGYATGEPPDGVDCG